MDWDTRTSMMDDFYECSGLLYCLCDGDGKLLHGAAGEIDLVKPAYYQYALMDFRLQKRDTNHPLALLLDYGLFVGIAQLSEELFLIAGPVGPFDKKRAEMYKQNAQRAQLEQSFGDYNDYLKSLEMHCEIGAFDEPHAERITQLINKTNQFNLTTRRYTAAEVEGIMADPAYITLYGRLVDKFGDNGLVTAMIGHIQDNVLDMDLWIMSCRTFKRRLEHAMFDELVRRAAAAGVEKIVGHYYPTAKNLLVKDFYATIGFEQTAEDEAGNRTFEFTGFDGYKPQCGVMEIRRV